MEWVISSCVMILLVILIRFIFRKKMQPCIRYALWLAVALRLLLPFSFFSTAVSVLNFVPKQTESETDRENGQGENRLQKTQPGNLIREIQGEGQMQAMEAAGESEGEEQDRNRRQNRRSSINLPGKAEKGKGTYSAESAQSLLSGSERKVIRLAGTGFFALLFLAVNLDYSRRLGRSRKRMDREKLPAYLEIPVYTAEMLQTPCLFGFFCPSVYVTEEIAGDEDTMAFVLRHENAHYRHHDNWWVFVRNLCLCLHWYNPLVWLAASLSRQDGELACDEKVVAILGREARVDYGRTLLALGTTKTSGISGWLSSTAMGNSKRRMKERLQMILNMPQKSVENRVLLLILMVPVLIVTFTGRSLAAAQDEVREQTQEEEAFQQEKAFQEEVFQEEKAFQQEKAFQEEEAEALRKQEEGVDGGRSAGQEDFWTEEMQDVSLSAGSGVLRLDLNFDGRDDLCFPGQYNGGENVPYYCMIWDEEKHQYVKSVMLYNVETDRENRWITSRRKEENGRYSTTYYRYDEDNRLHMLRYVEENESSDGEKDRLDLTYVEKDDMYTLAAVVDGTDFDRTLLTMAKQALTELSLWTGEKIDTACFQVTNMGSVYFSVTPEDMEHSRIFFNRDFGADTVYNLSNYEKSISSMYVASGRSVWYSPVLWRVFPEGIDRMTDEEIIIWYLERTPLIENCRVKSVEKRYTDMWTMETESGVWFEVIYDTELKEVGGVIGPYPDKPVH